MHKPTSVADIRALASDLPKADKTSIDAARARQNQLTKPPGSLGTLEDIAVFMAGWQGTGTPKIDTAQALVFAGNHGICAQGVNPFPQEVTAQMVANFEAGGAAINQLCNANGATLSVIALDLDRPTADFTEAPAMNDADLKTALQTGFDAVDPKAQIIILGEMGIGNSTVAAALACACFGAVAPLAAETPAFLDHCLIGHASAEPGHARLMTAMNKSPILDFNMRLGEGTGAALALGIVRSALACHNGMATFAEAGVSGG